MRGILARLSIVCSSLVLLSPSALWAQSAASIAGVVKDSSGGVLPGVTVEASSPALIEKTRTAITDATGAYRIVNLQSGTYTLTFSLPGFSTVKRDGVDLSGSFVATINAEMRVGAIEETVTVTSDAPVVDVQSTKTESVLSSSVLTSIPTGRNYENLHVLVPGVSLPAGSQDVGGSTGAGLTHFTAHGGDVHDSHVLVNGMSVAAPQQNGGRTMYVPNAGSSQEVSITTSQSLAESDTDGVTVNVVYKDGGNLFKGMFFGAGSTQSMQSNNFDDALRTAGLRVPNTLKNLYDYEATLGGPIKKDKLWFYGGSRWHGDTKYVAGMFFNKNAGDITQWTYAPDTTRQALNDEYWLNGYLRLTWQATTRNKITAYYEDALRCTTCNNGGSPTASPETSGHGATHPDGLKQLTWTSPLTNRVLLEAGFSLHTERWGSDPRADFNPRLIPVSAQGGSLPGLTYRAPAALTKSWIATYGTRASITYTSGSHSMKFGYNGEAFNYSQSGAGGSFDTIPLAYRFTTPDPGGVPNLVTVNAWPFGFFERLNNWGLYGQDQWTSGRLTVGAGARFDRFTAFFPASHLGPTQYVPVRLDFPEVETTVLSDITPRLSIAYDLTGNGKTAIKIGLNKYVLSQSSEQYELGGKAAPLNAIPKSYSRSWKDKNGNFVPDCDLTNLDANGECGPSNTKNFGKSVVSTTLDPSLSHGWGNRPYNWAFDVSVTREVLPNLAINVGYFRRWFGNFIVTQNRATLASDYKFFGIPVSDPRLPISGVVNGFFDVNPDKFAVFDNFVTKAGNFGDEILHWNGMDFDVNARVKGLTLQGGVSTGRQSKDVCAVAAQVPTVLLTSNTPIGGAAASATSIAMDYCHSDQPFQTQAKLLGAYTVPRIDVLVSGTFQNLPGQELFATYVVPNSVAAPLLGRDLSGNAANMTVNLLPPGKFYAPRMSQLDLRVAKILKFGGRRLQVGLDLFNALNTNAVQTYNPSYSPTGAWMKPTLIVPARLARISAQFDF